VARTFDREISYLRIAGLNTDTSRFLVDALSRVMLAGPLESLIGSVHGFHV